LVVVVLILNGLKENHARWSEVLDYLEVQLQNEHNGIKKSS